MYIAHPRPPHAPTPARVVSPPGRKEHPPARAWPTARVKERTRYPCSPVPSASDTSTPSTPFSVSTLLAYVVTVCLTP